MIKLEIELDVCKKFETLALIEHCLQYLDETNLKYLITSIEHKLDYANSIKPSECLDSMASPEYKFKGVGGCNIIGVNPGHVEKYEVQTDPTKVDLTGMSTPDDLKTKKRGRPAKTSIEKQVESSLEIMGKFAQVLVPTAEDVTSEIEIISQADVTTDELPLEHTPVPPIDANGLMALIVTATKENKLTLQQVNEIIYSVAGVSTIPEVLQMVEMLPLVAAEIEGRL